MKRLIAALVIGALATALCVWSHVWVNGAVDEIAGKLNAAVEAWQNDDLDETRAKTDEALDKWRHYQAKFEFFSGKDTVHEVDHSIERLKILLEYGDEEWFAIEARQAVFCLELIAFSETFSLRNIL